MNSRLIAFPIVFAVAISSYGFAQSLNDALALLINRVFLEDSGKLLAEATRDIAKADAALNDALDVPALIALGEPIDAKPTSEYLEIDQGEFFLSGYEISEINSKISRSVKYYNAAHRKISLALELGAGEELLPENIVRYASILDISANNYSDIFIHMLGIIENYIKNTNFEDIQNTLTNSAMIKNQMTEVRTILLGAPPDDPNK